jgi:hypothetical protein
MPKMTDSRRKKIQARQRQALSALRREKKAAKRQQRKAKAVAAGPEGVPSASARA